jgi:dUTP pyrophosphatase
MMLKFKRLHGDAILPTYASEGAACFDLYAITPYGIVDIPPGEATSVNTGLAVEVPPGWVLKVYSRSGHGFKHGIRLVNGVGIIDSDYRGELIVGLHNDRSDRVFEVRHGDRIAQAMLERAERVEIVEVDSLTETMRGAGGFGSTGA